MSINSVSRRTFLTTFGGGALALALAGCGSSSTSDTASSSSSSGSSSSTASDSADKTITVGASPSPHAEILASIEEALAADGWTLNVVEYSDYIQPNVALSEGELDANYFQHQPYLDDYNAENGTDLVGAAAIHFEPMGIYPGKTADLASIADGATIAVPSDATNEARALLLLEAQGVITLKEGVGLEATANDIEENPHNIELVEVEAAAVPRTLEDADFGVINGNYALSAGLDTSATLASEAVDSEAAETYANVVAVRNGEESSDKTKALIAALESDETKAFIEETYKGSVVAVF